MNPVIQCIILLACVAICTSLPITKCRCINTTKRVTSAPIVEINEYKPRPYCNQHEVIVKLKDDSSWCLDPNSTFTKLILQRKKMNMAAKMTSSSKTTTVAPTASAPTSS